MQTYFVHTLVIQLAAKLLQKEAIKQYINYACCGVLKANRELDAVSIQQTEGIDDMLDKAEALRFGQVCANSVDYNLSECNEEQLQYYDAIVASIFIDISSYSDEQIKDIIIMLIRAFTKRAQIQTHTTKPGYEAIDEWLDSLYSFQTEYGDFVEEFSQLIIKASKDEKKSEFFSIEDPIIALAISGQIIDDEKFKRIFEKTPVTSFGRILCDICRAEM